MRYAAYANTSTAVERIGAVAASPARYVAIKCSTVGASFFADVAASASSMHARRLGTARPYATLVRRPLCSARVRSIDCLIQLPTSRGARVTIETGQPIRWGIIGTGWIAKAFAGDLTRLPDAEVVAVGSRSQSSADAFADQIRHRPAARDIRRPGH